MRDKHYVHPDGGRIVLADEDCPELDQHLAEIGASEVQEEDFEDKKVGELREMAKEQGVENADDLKKAELIEALKGDK